MRKIYGTVLMFFVLGTGFGMAVAGAIVEGQREEERARINFVLVEMSRHYLECVDEVKALGGGDAWEGHER